MQLINHQLLPYRTRADGHFKGAAGMSEPVSGDRYYVRSMGRVTGPFDADRLRKLRARGQFGPGSEVSVDKVNWSSWNSLDAVTRPTTEKRNRQAVASSEAVETEIRLPPVTVTPALLPVSAPEWHYAADSASHGPVSAEELRALLAAGTLPRSTLVWRDGQEEWQPASQIAEFSAGQPGVSQHASPTGGDKGRLRYANFWRRLAAWGFDHVILTVIGYGLALVVVSNVLPSGVSWEQIYVVATCALLLLNWLYHAAFESSSLQATLGKLAIELKVTSLSGDRIGFGRASGRYFAKILSALLFGVGFLMVAFTQRRQALHDLLTDCLVVDQES
jgi:uncharacterized RDD family membrane protein YckC